MSYISNFLEKNITVNSNLLLSLNVYLKDRTIYIMTVYLADQRVQ